MFTVTKDLILPSTTTGSFPRPRWFDVSMWGKPLDTCMLDVRFREKLQDALAVVVSDQERAGLDILTSGDFHCDEDLAGRSWHHYPIQRWAGLEGDYLQAEETRSDFVAVTETEGDVTRGKTVGSVTATKSHGWSLRAVEARRPASTIFSSVAFGIGSGL